MDANQFSAISKKLEIIMKLLGLQIIMDRDFREQVRVLDRVGIEVKEIATLTGKTENNIRVTLHKIKKAKKRGGKEQ